VQEARDLGGIVRQYTKMEHRLEHQDNPGLTISRMLQVAMSEPQGPVFLCMPRETAMLPLPGVARFPTRDRMGLARPTWPDPDDARTIAQWLVAAQNPVLFTARIGQDPAAIPEFVRLAELLAIPVMESSPLATRMNFPATHPLYGCGPSARDADVVLVADDLTPFTPGVELSRCRCQNRMDQRGSGALALQDDGIPRGSLARVHTCQRRARDLRRGREVAGSNQPESYRGPEETPRRAEPPALGGRGSACSSGRPVVARHGPVDLVPVEQGTAARCHHRKRRFKQWRFCAYLRSTRSAGHLSPHGKQCGRLGIGSSAWR
jgi:hypothetical protein